MNNMPSLKIQKQISKGVVGIWEANLCILGSVYDVGLKTGITGSRISFV